ncbi:preprotein translocase subunit YajC [Enterococcus sp. BWB1-3]|uniref:preprotein translocase subunit YajC n=1 Tax=Enterococcus sp. BWB1-3 TaxID=2787713 RepID=UPI0019225AC2|nr:preprotein translocase subunit YajC [Enterococcus sp. BWB1-3]MBL1227745.1 preprotein translocase subunit YajC [Enterococcus sp. BWB1-3]
MNSEVKIMGNGFTMILTLVVLGGMMFFMTRSQKQQKEHQILLNNMKVGDKVVTIGRLHGVVSEIDSVNKTVFIDCEGIILEFDHSAIRTVKPNTTSTSEPIEQMEEPAAVVLEKEETITDIDTDDSTEEQEETKE